MKDLLPMDDEAIDWADFVYRTRLQALAGIDEIIADVIDVLQNKGVINNTYSKSPTILIAISLSVSMTCVIYRDPRR